MSFLIGSRVHFWQHARLFLAPLLAIVLLTIGCGRPPRPLTAPADRVAPRRAQMVEVFNVGVGLNTSTGQMFMFSDLQAAKQSPEASTSFLVALDGYSLHNGGTSGQIDIQAVIPGGGQYPVLASVAHFNSSFDWSAEFLRTDREISSELFETIAARVGMLTAPATASPGEVVSLATDDGAYTTGTSWGDIRLMLAAIGAWARQQPQSMWSASSGQPGGEIGGTLETVWAESLIGIQVDPVTLGITPLTQMPQGGATSSLVIVKLESADFASGSATPSAVTLRIVPPTGIETVQRVGTASFRTAGWRPLLGAYTPPALSETVLAQVQEQSAKTLSTSWYSSVESAATLALGGLTSQDSIVEAGTVMAAAAHGMLFARPGMPDRSFLLGDFLLTSASSDSPEPGEVKVPFPLGIAVPEGTGAAAAQVDVNHRAFDRLALHAVLESIVFSDGRAVAMKVRVRSAIGAYIARIAIPLELQRFDWSIFQNEQAPLLVSDEVMAEVNATLESAVDTASSGRSVQSFRDMWETVWDQNGCRAALLDNINLRASIANGGEGFWIAVAAAGAASLAFLVCAFGIAAGGPIGAALWTFESRFFTIGLVWAAAQFVQAFRAFQDTERDCILANSGSFDERICATAIPAYVAGSISTCDVHNRSILTAALQSDGTTIFNTDAHDIILWFRPDDPGVYGWKVRSYFWMVMSDLAPS